MKRLIGAACLISVAACSAEYDKPESLGQASEALNGELSDNGYLTRHNIAETDEQLRRADTNTYYTKVGTSPNNGTAGPISTALPDLETFQSIYGFNSLPQTVAKYYNRGDLGLGREMHCVDIPSNQQVACYVTNYAAGTGEFTFGFSRDIAFSNMDAHNELATVAMVFRKNATKQKMLFVAFGPPDPQTQKRNRVDNAPLDRHGLDFVLSGTGTPGTQFNNHIPSNCQNCHGGTYDSAHLVNNSLFLPFDLDQFDFRDVAGETRDEQEPQFRALNNLVYKVATWSNPGGSPTPLQKQLEGWYTKGSDEDGDGVPDLTGDFNSAFVPPAWKTNSAQKDVYRRVVRPSCRGCHLVSAFNFDGPETFSPTLVKNLINQNNMPHALQTQREFWLTGQSVELENYFRSLGTTDGTSAADVVRDASPKNIVTLDPHVISAFL